MYSDRRAVFLDVDGTLVNDRGHVPDSARLAVDRARANGHLVFMCTGRSMSQLWPEVVEVGFDGIIGAAGGYVEHASTVVLHHTVPMPELAHAIRYLTQRDIDYLLEANDGVYGSQRARERLKQIYFGPVTDSVLLRDLREGPGAFLDSMTPDVGTERMSVNKILFLGSRTPVEWIRAEFASSFDLTPAPQGMFGQNSGELSMRGVHKGRAIEVLIGQLGIARTDTVAYGDGLNDLEMLMYVNTGVAMGSAQPEVRGVADRVTGSPDEDGILTSFTDLGLI